MKHSKRNTKGRFAFHAAVFALLAFTMAFCKLSRWFIMNFSVGITEILYTINAPTKGAGYIFKDAVGGPRTRAVFFGVLALYPLYALLLERAAARGGIKIGIPVGRGRRISLELCALARSFSVGFLAALFFVYAARDIRALKVREYLNAQKATSTLFEDHYVEPDVSLVTGKGKNLICIYLESMETAYAAKDAGGAQRVNYIPQLTKLAEQNVSFTTRAEKGAGGFRAASGTTWTFGALLGTSSGIPFKFPFGGNHLDWFSDDSLTSVVTLGDILAQKGYTNEFLCGSDGDFAGRRQFFEQNGGYRVFDYFSAIERGYIAPDYHVWWGFEDEILYRIAKDEITRLAESEKPFNFTMLTVDTHFVGGYRCALCKDEHDEPFANIVACADSQVADFVAWIQAQDFYEDTVIVISGDHPYMGNEVAGAIPYRERTVYDCFINSAAQAKGGETGREFNTLDMFPTVLAAMGFSVEGERLGLGTNLFSGKQTLSEELGFDALNAELDKHSDFYEKRFY